MVNCKSLFFVLIPFLFGCIEQEEDQFFTGSASDVEKRFHYRDIHNITLSLSQLNKVIDETGFAPIFKGQFSLENTQQGPFEKAWVAFTINILVANKIIASIQRAGVLQDHKMDVQFQHNLPKFGLSEEQVTIKVTPVAWMPSYPLSISRDER
ncbi:hypothetical protein NBRC116188_20740 [Oceaniserpentilla sp. 4NH20-0058]|uniref:hypothetical protein n=1 Tax=Oceaniserpentilla sp. 4NH20-0058 TaxID=3127660 RepID=UPI0031089BE4